MAKEWRRALDVGECPSPAALARHFKISRARVTQIMNVLRLAPEVIEMISSLGDPLTSPIITERILRPLLPLNTDQQKVRLKLILVKNNQ